MAHDALHVLADPEAELEPALVERFMAFVRPGDRGAAACWEWLGFRDEDGYGRFHLGPRGAGVARAHRMAWRIFVGAIPPDHRVGQTCGNRACVRPEHLRCGTASAAMRAARARRGSWSPNGERNGRAKLTREQVRILRGLARRGVTARELGALFGISKSGAAAIARGARRAYG